MLRVLNHLCMQGWNETAQWRNYMADNLDFKPVPQQNAKDVKQFCWYVDTKRRLEEKYA